MSLWTELLVLVILAYATGLTGGWLLWKIGRAID